MFLSDKLKGALPARARAAGAAPQPAAVPPASKADGPNERRQERKFFAAGVRLHIGHVDDLRADKRRAWTFAVASAAFAVLVLAFSVPVVVYLASLPRERAVIVERDPVTHDLHFAGGLINDKGQMGAVTPLAVDRDPRIRDDVRRAIAHWIEDLYSTPNDTIALTQAKARVYAATANGSQALNVVDGIYKNKATNPFNVARTTRNDVHVADVSAYGGNEYRISWYVQAYDPAPGGKPIGTPQLFTDPRATVVVQPGVAEKSLNEAEIFVTHFMPQAEVK